MNEIKPHGWYWWEGSAPEKNIFGHRYTAKSNWVVHCWTSKGEGYASSANWREPMNQSDMTKNGTWGPQVIWDKKKQTFPSSDALDDALENIKLELITQDSNLEQFDLDEDDPFGYREHGYHGQD